MHAMLHTDCLVNVLRETVLFCMYCVHACMRAYSPSVSRMFL